MSDERFGAKSVKNWSVISSMRGKRQINLQILVEQTLLVPKHMKERFSLKAIWHRYSFRPEVFIYEERRKLCYDVFYCTSKHIFVDIAKFQEI